ncbi:MAG: bifunctional hydroxymethylpyrimidine kinase/phosphomethylpyrimidine kinase [Alphaproteobacteria bacterium]
MNGRVLIIAGSDSGGGAGIQADIKTVTALGGYAMTAITALTAQNTLGVHGVMPVTPAFVARQIDVVLDDLGADAIKIGMLANAEIADAVADRLERTAGRIPLVLDPVMVAKGGARLMDEAAIATIKRRLIPLAAVVTPNIPEAEVLTGLAIAGEADLLPAADALLDMGAAHALMKGGHLPLKYDMLVDRLVGADIDRSFGDARIDTRHTHGTGCTLASAIATGLAQGMAVVDAVARARAYVRRAIETAPGYGGGHGPLNHGWTLDPARVAALGAGG